MSRQFFGGFITGASTVVLVGVGLVLLGPGKEAVEAFVDRWWVK